MILYGGERVTPYSGAPSIHTIGASLATITRFGGHSKVWYSVLAHSFTVAELVKPKFGIYALMHDAPECMVGDVPTPMKTQTARNREHMLLKRIYTLNGLPWPIPEAAQEAVDEADDLALIAEAHILKHPGVELQWGDDYDDAAGELTKKHLRSVKKWWEDRDKAGAAFERRFHNYVSLAGLDPIEVWS